MAALGAAQTSSFLIGTAELRLGLLSEANLLKQSHSIGLIDQATYSVEQENVDLEGGFPKKIVDTAIIRQAATVSATMREYSRRNLRIALGDGLAGTAPTEFTTLVVGDVPAGSSAITVSVGDGASISVDDVVIIYPEGRPQDVSVLQVASIAIDTLTMKTGHTTAVDYNAAAEAGTSFHVYVANQVPIGAISKTNYFSAMLIQQHNSTGKPNTVSFWKAATSGSMEIATNADDFASSELELKCLEPAAAEYGVGGPLEHVSDLIALHPTGMLMLG